MPDLSSAYAARRGDDAIERLTNLLANAIARIEVLERLVADLRAHTIHPPG